MKKLMMTTALLLTLTMGLQAAQKPTAKQVTKELVDSTNKDAIEVFSDTTSVDSAQAQPIANEDDEEDMARYPMTTLDRLAEKMQGDTTSGIIFILGVLFILFVLSPVALIVALFYFLTKNRRDKMKLAQMAMQNGQPIPDQLLNETVTDEFKKGLRQCCVGAGLMIFLGVTVGEVGFGIGALVFCIGLGKVIVGKMAEKKNRGEM